MEYNEINHSIFNALMGIAPIATSRASMFPSDDRYGYLPFLRFRFKEKKKNDPIYQTIEIILNNFQGYLKWDLYAKQGSENYIITADCFFKHMNDSVQDKKNLKNNEEFRLNIDKAMKDIPLLTNELLKII